MIAKGAGSHLHHTPIKH